MYRIDHLTRPTSSQFGRHHGIQLPNGSVAHLTPDKNAVITTYNDFAKGSNVRIEKTICDPKEVQDTLQRLHKSLRSQEPYDLVMNNCEVFARGAIGQPKISWQVVAVFAVVGLLLIPN